jgi:UDPglucose 6-dehydrogenase
MVKDKSVRTMNVGVIGAGYVGLVTGACLASIGHNVTCIDKDLARVAELSEGHVPIFEPGLAEMIREARPHLAFDSELSAIVDHADVVFIAVETPEADDGSADLSSVATVARAIGAELVRSSRQRTLVVVNKSTVPVGSGDFVSALIREGAEDEGGADVPFRVVSNPEFLREGSAIVDSLFPDRIVLGTDDSHALDVMTTLYAPILEQTFPTDHVSRPREVQLLTTDLASAEMIKYAANAFLATKISFINEIASICDLVGADVSRVAAGIGLDSRIGTKFLDAGIGWGGSCFPKDVAALRSIAREYGHDSPMLEATETINREQRRRVISKLQRELRTLKGKRIALLGLTFKPNTDDLRDAPSLEIAQMLHALGARVTGYDPVAAKSVSNISTDLKVMTEPMDALAGAHAAVVVTEWDEIVSLDLARMAEVMDAPRVLIDGRNVIDPEDARRAGLVYRGFGRG